MTKEELKNEILRKETDMNEYWEALKKHDPTSYSYPFHQAKVIDKLKKQLQELEARKCEYCTEEDGNTDTILPNGMCAYHNYFFGNK